MGVFFGINHEEELRCKGETKPSLLCYIVTAALSDVPIAEGANAAAHL